jgi:hypothetical protein
LPERDKEGGPHDCLRFGRQDVTRADRMDHVDQSRMPWLRSSMDTRQPLAIPDR